MYSDEMETVIFDLTDELEKTKKELSRVKKELQLKEKIFKIMAYRFRHIVTQYEHNLSKEIMQKFKGNGEN